MIQLSITPKGEMLSDLGIDLGTFRCGKSCLTPREHQILGLLNNHFGLMVSWDRLINMLYDARSDGGPNDPRNVVAVLVCFLRRKMRQTGYEIVTVHSEGLLLKHRAPLGRNLTAAAHDAKTGKDGAVTPLAPSAATEARYSITSAASSSRSP